MFPFRAAGPFMARIDPDNPYDPLLRQIQPIADEMVQHENFAIDPLQESKYQPVPGVLHKYHGRVLLIVTGACAIHCRYCFRRHFSYTDNSLTNARLNQALDYINNDTTIDEIILSGGDPFMLSNQRLGELISLLEQIKHLQRLRIHTRIPVVDPERIDSELIGRLNNNRFTTSVVIHANHPQELNHEVRDALSTLRTAGIHLLNQSVLLAGVNDSAEILIELSKKLFEFGVLPYYLHMLDPVSGTAHFHVDDGTANKIINNIRARLPGYLVPKLVREIPGETHKQIL